MKMILAAALLAGCGAPQESTPEAHAPVRETVSAKTSSEKAPDAIAPASVPGYDGRLGVALSAEALPPCDGLTQGAAFYIQTTALFAVCDGGAWKDLDLRGAAGETGAAGATGAPGAKGADGATGAQGAASEAGAGAVAAHRAADDARVGSVLGASTIVFAGGGVADFNFSTGTFSGAKIVVNTTSVYTGYCGFTTTDCSGTCYATHEFFTPTSTVRNSVFYTGTAWVRTTGTEADAGAVTLLSIFTGQCRAPSAAVQQDHSFPVVTPWALPAGLTMPLGGLYIE